MLIDLRSKDSRYLAYSPSPPQYKGPYDDLIILAHSARHHDVGMYILNDDLYGYMLIPMEEHNTLDEEHEQFIHLRMEAIGILW
jgi:collagen beta-1,O-galactosyltransferase